MSDLRQAAQQALEALEGGADSWQRVGPAITALRAALAEPPVDDPHRDHWVAIAEAAQKIAASKECGLMEAKALCAALDRLTDAALAEPVQEPVLQALCEADRIMGHDDEATEWRERWAHLFSCALTNGGYQCSCGASQKVHRPAPPQRKPEPNSDYERGFVDGMSEQARRSVDKAVNAMTQCKPLVEEEIAGLVTNDMVKFARAVERAHGIGGEE